MKTNASRIKAARKVNREKQARLRLRRKEAGLVAVQGIWATPQQATLIKEFAKDLVGIEEEGLSYSFGFTIDRGSKWAGWTGKKK